MHGRVVRKKTTATTDADWRRLEERKSAARGWPLLQWHYRSSDLAARPREGRAADQGAQYSYPRPHPCTLPSSARLNHLSACVVGVVHAVLVRSTVRALALSPSCPGLRAILGGWGREAVMHTESSTIDLRPALTAKSHPISRYQHLPHSSHSGYHSI